MHVQQLTLLHLSPMELRSIGADLHAWAAAKEIPNPPQLLGQIAADIDDFMTMVGGDPKYFSYLALIPSSRASIGIGGFKGPPNKNSELEMLLMLFPEYQGQGLGTVLAEAVVEQARQWTNVQYLTAHTPPSGSAITRILEKIGMQNIGSIQDEQDGELWRWTMLC